jgi:hypothetical protein
MGLIQTASVIPGFRHASLSVLALTLTFLGCQTEAERSGSVVRDSAGVEIVENSDFAWPDGQGWRLASQPVLDIGAIDTDPNQQLFQVVGALRLSDDRIVIANSGTSELRFYDISGRFISKSGRKGGGPGEFQGLRWLGRTGADSLLAFDWRTRRLSIFDPAGNFVRSVTLDALAPAPPSHIYVGLFGDGSLMIGAQRLFAAGTIQSGVHNDTIFHLRFDSRGLTHDTIGRHPGAESYILVHDGGLELVPLPFGRTPRTAVYQSAYYFGRGDSYAIDLYSAAGKLTRSIRNRKPNERVTADDRRRYIERSLEGIDDDDERRVIESLMSDIPFPATMPVYAELRLDSEGYLWVEDYRKAGDERPRWTVFDPSGRMLGMVEMPDRFTIHQIGPDFVLGSGKDEMDIEHVRLYELIKPR